MPSLRERRASSRAGRAVAVLLMLELVGGVVGSVATAPDGQRAAGPPTVLGRVTPDVDVAREKAVRELLDVRARALLDRDRAEWLSTVDPDAVDFRARQAALFDALAAVPVDDWSYRLDATVGSPADVDLDAIRGRGWWAPAVTLTYRITGYDDVPTVEPQHLTFVPRGAAWFVASDDDFAKLGKDTTRGLWDSAPVAATRGRSCIVLGHPGSRTLMRRIAASVDAAVPRVVSVWGRSWPRRVVVLVPSSQRELARIVGGSGDYSQIAAVATAELIDTGYHPVGNRIVVNPVNFDKLGPLGRRVVLTHEVTHVATRAATGPGVPTWLVEGFADYVGYSGLDVPYRVSAAELRDRIRRGQVPRRLPSDQEYDGTNKHLSDVYEQGWLAVSLIARTYGQARLLRLYRAIGGEGMSVDEAFHAVLGTDVPAFTQAWRRDLVTRLR